jgi:predicted Zn-dependent protease
MKPKLIIAFSILFLAGINYSCKKNVETTDNNVTPNDFLSGAKYNTMTIEINYINGFEPSDQSISDLVSFLSQRLNKGGGITFTKSAISVSNYGSTYTIANVQDIEKANRKNVTKGSTLTSYILFLDKSYAGNTSSGQILGITYANSSVVIFENTIMSLSGGLGQPSRSLLETTVLEHEFGHVMGLTNNGSSMQTAHQDTPNGKHCNNNACLMYYAVETSDVVQNLLGSSPPVLDANCLNDLRANGGK